MEKELNLLGFIRNILSNLRKYLWLFILIFLLGLGTSWFTYSKSKKMYRTDAIVYTNFTDFSTQSVKSMMELMNEYIVAGKTDVVSKAFSISREEASTITELSVTIPDVKDNTFFITMMVTTPKYLENIEQGILSYFNQNETKLKFDRLKTQRYEYMNALITREVNSLDSLWNNKDWNDDTDLGMLIQTKINLQDKKSSFNYTIDRINMGFSYVQNFNKEKLIVDGLNLKKYLFLGGFASMVIIGLILVLMELRRALKNEI